MMHKNSIITLTILVIALSAVQSAIVDPIIINDESDNKDVCNLCTDVVNQFKNLVKDPKMIDQIKTQLDNVCNGLQVFDLKKQCSDFLNKYVDQAIEYVRKVDPHKYCEQLKLCTPKQVVSMKRFEYNYVKDSNNTVCDHCQTFVKALGDFLTAHPNETSLVDIIKNVCLNDQTLPDPFDKASCTTLVGIMGQSIIGKIRNMKTPLEFCQKEVHLCA